MTINVHGNCERCPFKSATCGDRGPIDSPFVIVGESPGRNEIREGKPFVGDSGKMLAKVLNEAYKALGVTPIEPFLTNALSCHPINKDQRKLSDGVSACHSRLVDKIQKYPRKVILSLGAPAAWSILDNHSLKITQVRGQFYKSPLASSGVVLAVHPAFLMRGGGSFQKFKADIEMAVSLLVGKRLTRYVDSYHIEVKDEEGIWKIVQELVWRAKKRQRPTYLAADLETSGFSRIDDDILCTGVGWKFNQNFVIPEHLHGGAAYRALMQQPPDVVRYVWHNGKFDVGFLRHEPNGKVKGRVDEDTMMLSYVLDEVRGQHDLEQVSNDAVGAPNWKAMLDSHRSSKKASYREIPVPVLHKYLGKDVSATLQSFYVLRERAARSPDLEKAYTRTLIPMSNDLCKIEDIGMEVDMKQVGKNVERVGKLLQEADDRLNAVAIKRMGHKINLNSHQQVNSLIFDHLKIRPWKGQRSTNKDLIKKMPSHPVLIMLTEHRKIAKAYSTYVKPYMEKKSMHSDGRVHSSYLIHGSVTGRLASKDPNLQNIPRDPELRSQYVAPLGYRMVECDLNQAELRCLAHLSRCPELTKIYTDPNHPGLHHETSVALFGPNYDSEHKMRAKTVNFGIVYGRTGKSIAEEYHLPESEGNRWVEGWMKRFPGAARFIEQCREAPLRGIILRTVFGRQRRFGVVSWENKLDVQNQAANFPHQSTASDINYHATSKAMQHERIREIGSKFCNLVHDSNIALIPDDDEACKEHIRIVTGLMQAEPLLWGLNGVPFLADAKWGYRWGHLAGATAEGVANDKDGKAKKLWAAEYELRHGKPLVETHNAA